jgi:hypothetical protein
MLMGCGVQNQKKRTSVSIKVPSYALQLDIPTMPVDGKADDLSQVRSMSTSRLLQQSCWRVNIERDSIGDDVGTGRCACSIAPGKCSMMLGVQLDAVGRSILGETCSSISISCQFTNLSNSA